MAKNRGKAPKSILQTKEGFTITVRQALAKIRSSEGARQRTQSFSS
ncbi:MAG: hypothetical protein AOA65_2137 [Candidatus Bathyarchaeota archaeon BA1]|nr:MAG: hypothetical protein AOA65_2137 [Candidatus Bathyarchaeota archaeon BA1]